LRNSGDDHCSFNVVLPFVCEQLKEHEPQLIRTHTLIKYYYIRIRELIEMGALSGIGALINKNTFNGGRLFERWRLLEGGR